MSGLGGGNDSLRAGEEGGCLEDLGLLQCSGLDQTITHQIAEKRCVSMIAQATGMNSGRDEIVAQGEHLDHRGHARSIAEVIGIKPLGQGGAGSGLAGHHAKILLVLHFVRYEGEDHSREVASAAAAAEHDIGVVLGQSKLLLQLQALHCLVQQDMIEH